MKRNDLSYNLHMDKKSAAKAKKVPSPKKQPRVLERILIVENSFRPGIGLFVEKILQGTTHSLVDTRIVDSEEIVDNLESFHPDVVILDVDSLHYFNALTIALDMRKIDPAQVVVFMSERINPVLVKEGMVAALWSRAYWLNQPSRNPVMVLPAILRAFNGKPQLNPSVLEAALNDMTHLRQLSSQQHRVMRLMALGGSNASIARDCNLSVKAVERTIATASKLLEVEPASADTNHRVRAANRYLNLMLFADSIEPLQR